MCTLTAADRARVALIVAFSTILASQQCVKAQTPEDVVVANIPFAFQIGSSYLPAGTYRVQMKGDDLLWIKGESRSAVLMVMRDSAKKPSADSAVVFHHYGDQYFLREVRTEGDHNFLWFSETKAERRAKLQEDAANPNSGPREESKVEIALLAPPR